MQTIEELLAIPDVEAVWVCDPYVVQEGITFLHGKTSIGKSPLTWELARCVSMGLPFLDRMSTTPRRVLYIEADTPLSMLKPRLRKLREPLGTWWIEMVHSEGLDLANPGPKGLARLKGLYEACKPELVIWNTLRSLTRADLSKGETVSQVYQTLRTCFPEAAHFIVHHDRKVSTSSESVHVPDEDHSGSGAWRDTAQVVLHLRRRGDPSGKSYLALDHTKTQGSEKMTSQRLTLHEDGTNWVPDDTRDRILALWPEGQSRPEVSDVGSWVAEKLSMSRATVFRIKGKGKRPGSEA